VFQRLFGFLHDVEMSSKRARTSVHLKVKLPEVTEMSQRGARRQMLAQGRVTTSNWKMMQKADNKLSPFLQSV